MVKTLQAPPHHHHHLEGSHQKLRQTVSRYAGVFLPQTPTASQMSPRVTEPQLTTSVTKSGPCGWVCALHCPPSYPCFALPTAVTEVLGITVKQTSPSSCLRVRFRGNQSKTYSSVQFSSVAQSCPTLCDPMNHSTPGPPVRHQLPEFTQTHAYRVADTIQPSHPLSSPSPSAPNPSQHQGLFQ